MNDKNERVSYAIKIGRKGELPPHHSNGFQSDSIYSNAVRRVAEKNNITPRELEEFLRTGKRPKKGIEDGKV